MPWEYKNQRAESLDTSSPGWKLSGGFKVAVLDLCLQWDLRWNAAAQVLYEAPKALVRYAIACLKQQLLWNLWKFNSRPKSWFFLSWLLISPFQSVWEGEMVKQAVYGKLKWEQKPVQIMQQGSLCYKIALQMWLSLKDIKISTVIFLMKT